MFRVLGSLSSTQKGGLFYASLTKFASGKPDNYGKEYSPTSILKELEKYKLIFLGEIHSVPAIVGFQYKVIRHLTPPPSSSSSSSPPVSTLSSTKVGGNVHQKKLHVVMEQFSFDMQDKLDDFCQGKLSFRELDDWYHNRGKHDDANQKDDSSSPIEKPQNMEGHDLGPYQSLLEYMAKHNQQVKLHAGFVPRRYARMLLRDGAETTLRACQEWMPEATTTRSMVGHQTDDSSKEPTIDHEFHYRLFESMLSGRDLHATLSSSSSSKNSNPQWRRIFQAQVFKDVAMAEKIHRVLSSSSSTIEQRDENDGGTTNSGDDDDEQVVVIAGNGHVAHYQGVPSYVLERHPDLVSRTCVVTSHSQNSNDDQADDDGQVILSRRKIPDLFDSLCVGPRGANPADFLFVFDNVQDGEEHKYNVKSSPSPHVSNTTTSDNETSKAETQKAYDEIGSTAHLTGNTIRAKSILSYLGYSKKQIDSLVDSGDAYNFQGVGNPHLHANIQRDEAVLDIGSGLGIDSFLAAQSVGDDGMVVGVDLSAKQVQHAQRRAKERGDHVNTRFVAADMEQLPFPSNSFDVVISNGAFCLAPDKEQAFREIFRVLKPGGRMSVCTTTVKSSSSNDSGAAALDENEKWPLCMQMFIAQSSIRPMCEALGFNDVKVDDTDGKMVYEIELPVAAEDDDDASLALNPERHQVHVGSEEFQHLEKYNMDELCVRVCVVGTKPELKKQ